jgi:hypothetical protein
MVVEPETAPLDKRHVCQDIIPGHRNNAVLQVLGMAKLHIVYHAHLVKERGTAYPVKIEAR